MYDLPHHKEASAEAIRDFIAEQPFAVLIGCRADGRPVATQVPVFLEQKGDRQYLRGHLMRNTDHHRAFLENDEVLVLFPGHHVYVSGSWYRDPHTPSTWNYMSVHVRGTIRFLDGAELEQMLRTTSLHFEGGDERSPTVYDNLPPELTRKLVPAIAAFEVTVTEMGNVFKLSQDRDAESYRNIIEKLKLRGADGKRIAAEMEKRYDSLFPDGDERIPDACEKDAP